jgi:hypothetical protein
VIVKEGSPSLALITVRLSLREISRDGGEADRDPKFFEFSPNLSGAPAVLIWGIGGSSCVFSTAGEY